jgi:hypothetical protein
MTKINFENRAVAFIDVLGFKDLVNNACKNATSMNNLQSLIELLSSVVPALDKTVDNSVPARLIPEHTYISDTIILSAPISDDTVTSYNGLEILVMRCIQLTHYFLRSGYLLRGGIAVGKVWHEKSNIVGPGYHDAYLLEEKEDKPRIVLSENSLPHWKKGFGNGSRMCIQKDGIIMVNGLYDAYIPGNTKPEVINKTYDEYERIAENAINSSLPQPAKDKWVWFREYIETESHEGRQWSVA